MPKIHISASIITFNEEMNIGRCLDSIADIVDEIVVVDSFSTDRTEEICKRYEKVNFVRNPFSGHIEQKNYAKSLTNHEYVLYLDADELLDDQARMELQAIKQNPTADGYIFKRLNNYCGYWIYHGAWYPDKKLRLCRKSISHWGGQNPHDMLIANKGASINTLRGNIMHYSFGSVEAHKLQTEKFAKIAAEAMFKAGKRPNFVKMYLSPAFKLFRDYFIKMGFLDFRFGWTIAWINTTGTYRKYQLLNELYNNKIR